MTAPAVEQGQSYEAMAQGAGTNLGALVTVSKLFADLAEQERQVTGWLEAEKARWPAAAAAIDTAAAGLGQSTQALLGVWGSPEAKVYEQAVLRSRTSLADMATQLTGTPAGGPSASSGNLDAVIDPLMHDIPMVADQAKQLAAQIQQLQNDVNFTEGAAIGLAIAPEVLKGLSANLITVGQNLDNLGQRYIQVGQTAQSMAAAMQWQGPHSDVSGGDLARTPETGPDSPSSDPGGSPGGDPGGQPGDQPGQQPGGGAPGGQPGEQAGGQPGGGQPGGQPGELPGGGQPGTGPGGTELQGTQTLPKPVAPAVPIMPIDTAPAPPVTPLAPVAPVGSAGAGRGLTGGGLPRIGGGGSGIGSGLGSGIGAGIGTGGTGGSKLGGIKPLDKVDTHIPSVAKTGAADGAVSTGRAPSLPGGAGTGGTAAGTPGGAGIPPMMPPMGGAAAGAGGNGRGGKPGTGAIRPTGRERGRTPGGTPGVPDRLRGKAGQRAAFPSVPVAKTAVREVRPDTLEVLDEELWTVQASPEAATEPTRRYRPAN